MASPSNPLVEINAEINQAYLSDNFPRLLFLDGKRIVWLQVLASDPAFFEDDKNLKLIKETAVNNQKLVSCIAKRMTALTKKTNEKIKMLRSYHQNR